MKLNAAARGKARHLAVQSIYQWQMAELPVNVIEAQFHADNNMEKVDVDYYHELIHGVVDKSDELDQVFAEFLAKEMGSVDPVTLAVLRIASYEFVKRIDVPYRVVINEAVNLAKKFGAEDSHKFINGVLDKVAVKHRAVEVNASK